MPKCSKCGQYYTEGLSHLCITKPKEKTCLTCGGTGRYSDPLGYPVGYRQNMPCPTCGGRGKVRT